GFKFYWIPYWNASGNTDWKSMGFDFAWQQPNHFFNKVIPDSRLEEAYELADKAHMGLEMEFDDAALNSADESKRSRLLSYIESFERNGVFEHLSIAYYQGNAAFYNLSTSADEKDRQLYHYLADLISKRKARESSHLQGNIRPGQIQN